MLKLCKRIFFAANLFLTFISLKFSLLTNEITQLNNRNPESQPRISSFPEM